MRIQILVLMLFLGCSATQTTSQPSTSTECGVERWRVKTLSDADTLLVDLQHSIPTTIHTQVTIDTVNPGQNDTRYASERTVYLLTGEITDFKKEDDGDIHIVLRDTATLETMVAEIPNPDCSEVSATSRKALYAAARQWLVDNVGNPTTAFKQPKVKTIVTITGVGYYDMPHGQSGKAGNNREIHPVMTIQ